MQCGSNRQKKTTRVEMKKNYVKKGFLIWMRGKEREVKDSSSE